MSKKQSDLPKEQLSIQEQLDLAYKDAIEKGYGCLLGNRHIPLKELLLERTLDK